MSEAANTYVKPERGAQMTRLETFTDAAFAFAVTLLAISIDQIPTNYPELVETLKGAPAFAASFAILLLYWRAHHAWSQQYGLEDGPSIVLTAFLVFLVLIYVYPLKILFNLAFASLSNGWFPSNFDLQTFDNLRSIFTLYGIGFLFLNLAISLLYAYAWTQRKRLHMSAQESFLTLAEVVSWVGVGLFTLISIVLAWTLSDRFVPWAAWSYALLMFYGPLYNGIIARMARRRFPHTTA